MQQSLFLRNLHFNQEPINILIGPRLASASLGGSNHQDLIKYFYKEINNKI